MIYACLNNVKILNLKLFYLLYREDMFRFLFKLILITTLFQTTLYAENIKVFEFTDKELSELTVRKVRGADNKTSYSVGSNEKGNYLKSYS